MTVVFTDRTKDDSGLKRTEELINKGLGGAGAHIDELGFLSLNLSDKQLAGLTEEQRNFYDVLNNANTDSRGDVNINLVAGDHEVPIASWLTNTIDIQDVEKFGEKRAGADEFSVFGHEVREEQASQLDKKTIADGMTYLRDHKEGIKAEEKIKDNKRLGDESSTHLDPRGGKTGVSTFQYKDNKTGKITTVTVIYIAGNVASVDNN